MIRLYMLYFKLPKKGVYITDIRKAPIFLAERENPEKTAEGEKEESKEIH